MQHEGEFIVMEGRKMLQRSERDYEKESIVSDWFDSGDSAACFLRSGLCNTGTNAGTFGSYTADISLAGTVAVNTRDTGADSPG
jgi:hypothetical protein